MKTCEQCGEVSAEDALRCHYCGTPFSGAARLGDEAKNLADTAYTVGLLFTNIDGQRPVVMIFPNRNQLIDYLGFQYKYHLIAYARAGGRKLGQMELDHIQRDAAYVSIIRQLATAHGLLFFEALERFGLTPGYTPYEKHHDGP